MESTKTPPAGGADKRDWHLVLVLALMVVIMASLGALWLLEKRRRTDAEGELAETVQQARQMQAAMGRIMGGGMRLGGGGAVGAVTREDLPVETRTMDGQARKVLRISASAGERFGFEPGDVIEVGKPPEEPAEPEGDDTR
jgi:hypothetical protein